MQLMILLGIFIGFQINFVVASTDTFKVRLSSQPKTFDWTIATSGSEGAIIQNIMRGLFSFDQNRVPQPDLAKGFEWDSTSKILTLTLKPSVKWIDGKSLKCQQFRDSFERLLSPSLNSPNASLLFDIEMARDYFLGKEKDFSKVGVHCDKDDRLILTLKEPRSNFPNILTHWATFPVRKDKPAITLGAYKVNRPPGNVGPYMLNKVDASGPSPDSVEFNVMTDGSQALLQFQAGKLDYLLQVEDDLLNAGVLKFPGLGYVNPVRVVALLHLNPTRVLTNSPEKRRAIIARLPFQALYDSSPQVRLAADSIIPIGLPGNEKDTSPILYQAKGDQAKLPDSALTLGYPNDAFSKSLAQIIQDKASGIKIKIEPLPSGSSDIRGFDLVLSLFGLDYLDPDQLLAAFLSQGTLDLFNFSSGELVQLIQKARSTQNVKERGELYSQAADFLQHRAAIVAPLFYRRRAYLLSTKYTVERGAEGTAIMSKISLKKK